MAEKTGEPYDFVEIMPAYKNYVPDLQPAEADGSERVACLNCALCSLT
ncbi:MAG: hypothetical protein R3C56_25485 [Pirellulaceae bacterium]